MKRWRWFGMWAAIAALTVIALSLLLSPDPTVKTVQRSDYEISGTLAANQLDYYPLDQPVDPQYYRPLGNWSGRLILPSEAETRDQPGDWVWLELYQTPADQRGLVGQTVRLTWQGNPDLNRYLKLVTTDVTLSAAAKKSLDQGNIVPTRLDGRKQVGPLQSLAGARPIDDVTVRFNQAQVAIPDGNQTEVRVETMPELVTGRYQALVKILGPDPNAQDQGIPPDCPGSSPCPSELVQIQHYNLRSRQFDGPTETVRIPQQPRLNGDRFMSTHRNLSQSPVGGAGWYLYGAVGKDGLFTVQALKPRSLFQLEPTESLFGTNQGRDYIQTKNWQNTPQRKNTAQSVLIDPRSDSPAVALNQWQEGDRLLGMHLFGGIGGEKGEKVVLGTVTGHFSFSLPTVIRDPFTQELQWDIPYYQVYAQNPQGIVAASQTWENYAGNLRRGWVQSRPFSDVMIKLDVLEDYNFGGVVISPLDELARQLQIMMARYRTGDGTGNAAVTPAASCVQDSNQALYIAIERLRNQVQTNPTLQTWLNDNPNDPDVLRFQRLGRLGDRLLQALKPRGIIRADWQNNAETLAGITPQTSYPFIQEDTLANGLLSWQSMLPRASHDILAHIFLAQGANLWFLRPNQIGGEMPEILPLAPTSLFGEVPIISTAARRLLASMVFFPEAKDWAIFGTCLALYGAIALSVGFKKGFLQWQPWQKSPITWLKLTLLLLLTPALFEEILFRVLLLPYPTELNRVWPTLGAMALSLVLFVIYHPLNAWLFYKAGRPLFFQPIFLSLATLLGFWATVLYWFTGSLWLITLFHWAIVAIWLLFLGGNAKLTKAPSQ
ncbi:MAG: CPBP family glutamic-type intramembrane protease [Synechocystis sp.]|nr:CPBP family glutamic-type intramembrane protease [Synechocystis sp.]